MDIPDDIFRTHNNALVSLKSTLSTLDPYFQMTQFRNGCLKLNYHPWNQSGSASDSPSDLLVLVFNPNELSVSWMDSKIREFFGQTDVNNKLLEEHEDKLKLKHIPTSVKITLVTPQRQGCLMEYLSF